MKVQIEVEVTADRLKARVVGRDITLDEPNVVALVAENGTDRITGFGSAAEQEPGARLVPGVSIETFDPRIAAGVVGFLGLRVWDRLHPGWTGPLGLLDRVEVQVSIDRFTEIPDAQQQAFRRDLPYNPNVTWWVEGAKVDP